MAGIGYWSHCPNLYVTPELIKQNQGASMNRRNTLFTIAAFIAIPFLICISAYAYKAQANGMLLVGKYSYLPVVHNSLFYTPTATSTSAPTRTPKPAATSTQAPAPTKTATTSPQSGAFTFIAWADTKSGTTTLAALSNQVKPIKPAFTIYSGDLENAGFTTSGMNTWKNALNGNNSNGMFDMTLTLRGNHDTSNSSGWQSYFNASGTAARVGATRFSTLTQNLSYSFDYGNARFIALDVAGDASLITSAEISYLDGVLTDAESRGLTHAFIFFHGPIYAVSSHTSCATRTCTTPSSVASLVKVLNKHTIVSAIFNGHEHLQAYVHMDSSRVPEITHPFEEFIAGSAGAELNSCSKTFRFDTCGSYDGFASVTVNGRSYTVNIYRTGTASPVKTYTFTK
jgi:hypothetical protein